MIGDLVTRAVGEDVAAIEELTARAALDPASLAPHLGRLLDAGVHWPQTLYRGGGADFQRDLVGRIDRDEAANPYALLLILSHTRGPVVEEAFRRWREQTPPGAERLGVGIDELQHMGGWDLGPGGRRELCADRAYVLASDGEPAPLGAPAPLDETCPWCRSPLWTGLDVDTSDARVADALAHTSWQGRLRIVTCFFCVCYDTTYANVAPDGTSEWSPLTERPSYLGPMSEPEEPPLVRFAPGEARPGPYLANAWQSGGSTLGGHPDWIQDPDYPTCAACGTVMDYLGMLAGADIGEFQEGATYYFVHAACRLAAVLYQQS